MAKRAILAAAAILLAVIGLLPILVMFAKSLLVDGRVSFAYYQGLLATGRPWTLLGNSFALSVPTTLLATMIGLPLGILFARTDLPLRKLFAVLFTIPLLIPPYIIAVSWFDLLGREGFLAALLGPAVASVTSKWLFGLPGCVLVLFSTFMPIVMLLTMAYSKTVDLRLEEAGKLVSGWPFVLKGITIPLIFPGVLLAAMLVFLLTLGEFGVPTFLRYDVFPVESFTQFSAFYNFGAATAAAIPLALITFLVLVLESSFLQEKTYQIRPASAEATASPFRLGSLRNWCFVSVNLLCIAVVVVPLLIVVFRSFASGAYAEAISRASDSLLRSLAYAGIGATALTLVGFLTGYLIYTQALPVWRSIDSLTIFLVGLPSTVIGIGLIALWNTRATAFIYATPAIIVLGYLAQYAALASRITVTALGQIPPSMENAAEIVGAGWLRRMFWIVGPLARRGLTAAWLVGYIFCLRDTGITMLVYPPGRDTLPVRTFTLMANGSAGLIAALSVVMIVATLLPVGLLGVVFRTRRRAQ